MVTQLFDDKPRHYQGWARGAESIYAFYDRSALQEYGLLRRMLQRWADRFPNEHRSRIVSRMRHKGSGSATEDRQFNAALLELFLHEFLQGTGASVLVDPEIGGLTPDFKVTEQLDTGQQIDYVVEATDIEVGRNSELEIPGIERAALDVLNEIESPDFYLHVETSGALGSMPSKRSLKSPFEQLLKDTDYDRWIAENDYRHWNPDSMPSATCRHGNWTLKGYLMPVSPEYRPATGNFVGMGPSSSTLRKI